MTEIAALAKDNAIRLEQGGIYVIECSVSVGADTAKRMSDAINAEGERLGVKFLILFRDLKIARCAGEGD